MTRRERLEAISLRGQHLTNQQAIAAWRILMQLMHRYNDPSNFRRIKFNDLLIDIMRAAARAKHLCP